MFARPARTTARSDKKRWTPRSFIAALIAGAFVSAGLGLLPATVTYADDIATPPDATITVTATQELAPEPPPVTLAAESAPPAPVGEAIVETLEPVEPVRPAETVETVEQVETVDPVEPVETAEAIGQAAGSTPVPMEADAQADHPQDVEDHDDTKYEDCPVHEPPADVVISMTATCSLENASTGSVTVMLTNLVPNREYTATLNNGVPETFAGGSTNQHTYTDLPAGEYTIVIVARNHDGKHKGHPDGKSWMKTVTVGVCPEEPEVPEEPEEPEEPTVPTEPEEPAEPTTVPTPRTVLPNVLATTGGDPSDAIAWGLVLLPIGAGLMGLSRIIRRKVA